MAGLVHRGVEQHADEDECVACTLPSNPFRPPSFRFTHKVKLSSQLVGDPLQEGAIPYAAPLLLDFVNAQRGPGVNRRVDRELAVRMRSDGSDACTIRELSNELFFGEVGIHRR